MDIFPSTFFVQPLVSQDASSDDTFALIASSLKALLTTADCVFEKIEGRVRARACASSPPSARAAPFPAPPPPLRRPS